MQRPLSTVSDLLVTRSQLDLCGVRPGLCEAPCCPALPHTPAERAWTFCLRALPVSSAPNFLKLPTHQRLIPAMSLHLTFSLSGTFLPVSPPPARHLSSPFLGDVQTRMPAPPRIPNALSSSRVLFRLVMLLLDVYCVSLPCQQTVGSFRAETGVPSS